MEQTRENYLDAVAAVVAYECGEVYVNALIEAWNNKLSIQEAIKYVIEETNKSIERWNQNPYR